MEETSDDEGGVLLAVPTLAPTLLSNCHRLLYLWSPEQLFPVSCLFESAGLMLFKLLAGILL